MRHDTMKAMTAVLLAAATGASALGPQAPLPLPLPAPAVPGGPMGGAVMLPVSHEQSKLDTVLDIATIVLNGRAQAIRRDEYERRRRAELERREREERARREHERFERERHERDRRDRARREHDHGRDHERDHCGYEHRDDRRDDHRRGGWDRDGRGRGDHRRGRDFLRPGDRVLHSSYGAGTVVDAFRSHASVKFDNWSGHITVSLDNLGVAVRCESRVCEGERVYHNSYGPGTAVDVFDNGKALVKFDNWSGTIAVSISNLDDSRGRR